MHHLFFFFSSRRRHTRSLRDWSSDVCSSDLPVQLAPKVVRPKSSTVRAMRSPLPTCPSTFAFGTNISRKARRSEERRVGKECRTLWSPDQLIKKTLSLVGSAHHDQGAAVIVD